MHGLVWHKSPKYPTSFIKKIKTIFIILNIEIKNDYKDNWTIQGHVHDMVEPEFTVHTPLFWHGFGLHEVAASVAQFGPEKLGKHWQM